MTRRYVTAARLKRKPRLTIFDDDGGVESTIVVHEEDREPEWIGLYDAEGEKLYVEDEREMLGFDLRSAEER